MRRRFPYQAPTLGQQLRPRISGANLVRLTYPYPKIQKSSFLPNSSICFLWSVMLETRPEFGVGGYLEG